MAQQSNTLDVQQFARRFVFDDAAALTLTLTPTLTLTLILTLTPIYRPPPLPPPRYITNEADKQAALTIALDAESTAPISAVSDPADLILTQVCHFMLILACR